MTAARGAARGLVAVLALAVASRAARAQSCSATPTCSLDVPLTLVPTPLLRVSLSGTTTQLPPPTAADYAAGVGPAVAGPVVGVKANAPWVVQVAAGSAAFRYAGALADPRKPAGDLAIAAGPGTAFTPLALTAATLAGGSPTAALTLPLSLRAAWSWTRDVPGSYALPVVVTLAAP